MAEARDELACAVRCSSPEPEHARPLDVAEHLARCAALKDALRLPPGKSLLLGLSCTSAVVLVLLAFAQWPAVAPVAGGAAFIVAGAGRAARAYARRRQGPGAWPEVPWPFRPGASCCLMAVVAVAILSTRWDLVRIAWWAGGIGLVLSVSGAIPSRRAINKPPARIHGDPEEALRAFAEYLRPLASLGALPGVGAATPIELFAHWPRGQGAPNRPVPPEECACAWASAFARAKKAVLRRAGATHRESVLIEQQPTIVLDAVGPDTAKGAIVLTMHCRVDNVYLWGKPRIDPDAGYLVRVEVTLCRIGDSWLVESPLPAADAGGEDGP